MSIPKKYLMQSWKRIHENFFPDKNRANEFIIYKIVDSNIVDLTEYYKIQCINTKAIIKLNIQEIAFDLAILYGLHPVQGCFVGIEYSKIIRNYASDNIDTKLNANNFIQKYSLRRYGNNHLEYQDRVGRLGFRNCTTNEVFLMYPNEIAETKGLIEKFDVVQTFCIGVLAGLKLHKINVPTSFSRQYNKPINLRIIR